MLRAIAVFFSALLASAQALEVTGLRCEDLISPIGVDLPQPALSWQMEQDAGPRGQKQTAYQILVSSTAAKLAANDGDLWDSGQVSSGQSLRVSYAGAALPSRQRCHWKVRVWDKDGNPSAWSAPSQWTMGLLHPADWSAKWIAYSASGFDGAEWIWFNERNPASNAPPATRQFRRTITLPTDRALTSAKVSITADDSFTLTINGQEVASGTDWMQPVSANVTSALQSGSNNIAISATNGGTAATAAGLIARFDFTFATGEPLTVVTDTEWQASADGGSWSPALSLGAYGVGPWSSMNRSSFPHPWMRRNFEVKSKPERALVFVNTPGFFELYLNGKKVSDDVLNPAYSDFTKRMFVVAYDVTSLLQPGTNCIALWTAPGWYQSRYGNPYGSPIVRAQLEIETGDGHQTIGTDATWRTKASCITQVGNWGWADMGGERWNDAEFIPDWNLASHDDSSWNSAREVTPPNVAQVWPGIPGNRTLAAIKPVRISQINGKWVVDFGTRLTGWIHLRMKGLKPGQQVTIDYADLIAPRELMHMPDANGFQTFNQRDIFIAANSPERDFVSRFNQHAFQYAVIDGLGAELALTDIEALPVMTALEPAGSFECSNKLFNRIHEVSIQTLRSLIPNGVFGAGESREKEGYGDGANALTGFLYNFRSDAYFRKWLNDWLDSQRPDGFIAHTAPRHVDHGGGPAWGGAASELVRRLRIYHGNAAPAASAYPALKRYVDYLESHTKDGILRYYCPYGKNSMWFLGDWVAPGKSENDHGFPEETRDEQEFFNNCYRVMLWEQLAESAAAKGDTAEAQRCRHRLAEIRPLIHAQWYDEASQNYRVKRQAYLAIALLARIMPENLRPLILRRLDEAIAAKGGHLDTGMHGTAMLMHVLDEEGRHDLISQITAKTTFPSWGFLLDKRGVTTWPEIWTGWGSQVIGTIGNHGEWFHQGLAGIRPDPAAPGFRKFQVIPGVVDEVDWVRATHDSPYGTIAVAWRKQSNNSLKLDVIVPPNTSAEIHVPAKSAAIVSESGQPASSAPGVQFLRMENARAVFSVVAGKYSFLGRVAPNGER
jgi:alpha-L-rhamnosidase